MSSFNGDDLFGSGPHRFAVGREGRRVVPFAAISDPSAPGSFTAGDLELRVTVTGRLTADTEPDLWTLRDDITARAASTTDAATLIDDHGREWTGVKMLTFTPGQTTDRGRAFSLAYTAEFGRLTE